MELIGKKLCMRKDIGIHGNLFGGNMCAYIDEYAAIYATEVCKSERIVTVKIDTLEFKKPVKEGDIIRFYGETVKIGTSSLTIKIKVTRNNKDNTFETVCETQIVFVNIDEEGNPRPIDKGEDS
jgi:acyl-CoA thioesterase YciA